MEGQLSTSDILSPHHKTWLKTCEANFIDAVLTQNDNLSGTRDVLLTHGYTIDQVYQIYLKHGGKLSLIEFSNVVAPDWFKKL